MSGRGNPTLRGAGIATLRGRIRASEGDIHGLYHVLYVGDGAALRIAEARAGEGGRGAVHLAGTGGNVMEFLKAVADPTSLAEAMYGLSLRHQNPTTNFPSSTIRHRT